MSTFFKALEQAERDRNGRQRERTSREPSPSAAPDATVASTAPAAEVIPTPEPVSAGPRLESAAGHRPGSALADRTPANGSMPATPPAMRAIPPARVARPAVGVPASVAHEIDEHLVSLVEPSSFASEQYRVVRHAVEQLHRTAGHSIFGIGSPSASDGKTTTALNLAGALGQAHDARVLLIEADLRCPTMAERLGLDDDVGLPGLVDAIQSPDAGIVDVARRLTAYNLSVVLAGETPATPYEVLKSPRLGELLGEARSHYDYVVIDTPPVVAFPDCRILNNWVDGWLIVVAAHRTSRKLLEESLDLMDESKTVGFVFTHDERFQANARYYGGYYGARPGRVRPSRGR